MPRPALLSAAAAALLALALAPLASAATLHESGLGGFSGDWQAPTPVAPGVTSISGGWSGGNDHDFLTFAALPAGAQVLSFVFEAVPGYGDGYSAGGSVVYKTAPYEWSGWEGTSLGTVSFGSHNTGTPVTLTLELDDSFAGFLNIGLYGTHPHPLNYTIGVPSNALPAPAPVPLPAGVLLLGTALGGLGFVALRRRRTANG